MLVGCTCMQLMAPAAPSVTRWVRTQVQDTGGVSSLDRPLGQLDSLTQSLNAPSTQNVCFVVVVVS